MSLWRLGCSFYVFFPIFFNIYLDFSSVLVEFPFEKFCSYLNPSIWFVYATGAATNGTVLIYPSKIIDKTNHLFDIKKNTKTFRLHLTRTKQARHDSADLTSILTNDLAPSFHDRYRHLIPFELDLTFYFYVIFFPQLPTANRKSASPRPPLRLLIS